jgi:hypothetical protein
MATSGTVATTVISTDTLCDHALLRAGKHPTEQTPAIVQQCQESLYMLLLSLSNRGLNLWAVERIYRSLFDGQATYTTPDGTLEILNVIYSQPTIETTSFVAGVGGGTATNAASSLITRVGVDFAGIYTGGFYISVDGIPVDYQPTASYSSGLNWITLPKVYAGTTLTLSGTAGMTVNSILVASAVRDLPMTPINRDTYLALPNKAQRSHPCVNYWVEKKLTPQITTWPVADNGDDHLTIMVHRQVQDIGTLSQQIEVPQRWLEAITWQLALRMVFELPGIDPNRIQLVQGMAEKYLIEDERGESDGMPSQWQPNISPYTR